MHNCSDITRLLIVDDDLIVRTLAAEVLRAAGFEVSEAGDGISGLAQIEKHPPDLLLLDVMMPGMDGYEVCRTVRARPELARIPVIMLTGLDDPASVERAYESGATDFIPKPLNATLLAHRVRYALRSSRMLEVIDQHRARLANAQRIARLGSWVWQPASARFECSAEYCQVIGKHDLKPDYQWQDILHLVHPDDTRRVAGAMEAAVQSGKAYAIVYRIVAGDGSERTVSERAEAFRDSNDQVTRVEGTTQDITERVAAEERMRQLNDYDGLTGLANRRLFGEVMRHGLKRCERDKSHSAVLNINLDRFKRINETLGHAVGDEVLREVARRIVESIRAADLAGASRGAAQREVSARISDDGFGVFVAVLKRPEEAALIARRLREAISRPMTCGEHNLTLTASIGIAVYPDNGEEVGTMLKNAEAAMHSAKMVGTDCYFTPELNIRALAKLETENDLRVAIGRGELRLHYQARVDVPAGRIVGAEALVRWQHPRRGLVPPSEFIAIAEESGLIIPLTAWVLRAACYQIQQWQHAGLPVVPVSVNLSAQSFREDGLAELFASSLREYDVAPSLLEGEITESMLMHDIERGVVRLNELRAMGIELSMDDFGTGYSSLAHLKRFPLNALKIDRGFVKDVLVDGHDAAIASTIITLGKALKMLIVAEGMERVEQANFLLERGCRFMQGYLFARPVPAEDFARMLGEGLAMPPGLRINPAELRGIRQPPRLAVDRARHANVVAQGSGEDVYPRPSCLIGHTSAL